MPLQPFVAPPMTQNPLQPPLHQSPPLMPTHIPMPNQTISAIPISTIPTQQPLKSQDTNSMPPKRTETMMSVPTVRPKPQNPVQIQTTNVTTVTQGTAPENRLVRRRARLPRKARELLKKWFNEHLRYPYPTSNEKEMLQKQTGLTHRQIFNWFTNRRKRDPNWCPNKNPRSQGDKNQGKRKAANPPPAAVATAAAAAAAVAAAAAAATTTTSGSVVIPPNVKALQLQKDLAKRKKNPDFGTEAELLLALAG
eukprot:CAMPEP_0170182236 /NCGR_PEP_ID=MMETSP0040_2-20121228/27323_1 /TAXON_ID=641309 /ORGANISM="Lotharella oceanica, Strain CCMP622" /LENGTH=251 /DNA_ID=CAMNT_0010427585 /DNA_START=54 /DNA_END=809 /DNA_ORIENTATION=+